MGWYCVEDGALSKVPYFARVVFAGGCDVESVRREVDA